MDSSAKEVVIVIIAGTTAILLISALLIVYIYFYQQKQNSFIEEKEDLQKSFDEILKQSQIEVQETTMSSLGKELHDNVGQLLSSARMLLGITQRNLAEIPETLNAADESLSKAIVELRALSKSLSKEWLEQFSFLQNLKAEVARMNAAKIVSIHLSSPDEIDLVPEKQIILFRIVQEALQNVIKHAEATTIHIIITSLDNVMSLTIMDDGKGFEIPRLSKGMGLANMQQRTHLLGGNIEWQSVISKGCTIAINIPLKSISL